MIDATLDLKENQLQENFLHWISKLGNAVGVPGVSPNECLIPVTHTFGFYRESLGRKMHIYEDILYKDQALLSDEYRAKKEIGVPKKYHDRVRMSRARRLKLHHFVFSYFGVHDPYYTRSGDRPVPAFGVFIKTDIEKFPECNATRRDMASPQVKRPLRREFLLPGDARILAYLQSLKDPQHAGDFWHYWGDPLLFEKMKGYRDNNWQWKIEMHFRDMVPVESFDAILWPFALIAVGAGRMEQRLLGNYEKFRDEVPQCKIIPYEWNEPSPLYSLVRASYAVARFYFTHKRYPDDVDDAIAKIGGL